MGLFDTVRCEYPLPEPAHQKIEFQTKDFDCLLDEYLITRDGRLLRRAGRAPIEVAGIARDVEWPYHGDVRIYRTNPKDDRELIEYGVRFTNGRVEWIRRLGDETRAAIEAPETPPAPARTLRPEKWGRRLTAEEFHTHTPEKLELLGGDVPEAENLLLLLLTNLGLHRAALLAGPEEWKNALEDTGNEAKS